MKTDIALNYSIVIPVFNSEKLVGKTIEQTLAVCKRHQLHSELILVNDASTDGSASILNEWESISEEVRVIHLSRNVGQHLALWEGFKSALGNRIITMDDDLQNPPEEIRHLIEKADAGYDLVFGLFHQKQHSRFRVLGSRMVNRLNGWLYDKPSNLTVSNFRLITRPVLERMLVCQSTHPYVTGLAIAASKRPANASVVHHSRPDGKSQYTIKKLATLLSTMLFSHSTRPLTWGLKVSWGLIAAHLLLSLVLFIAWGIQPNVILFFGAFASLSLFGVWCILALILCYIMQLFAASDMGIELQPFSASTPEPPHER